MKIGVFADIHGDMAGFKAALEIYARQDIKVMLCAGDIVERGSEADAIVRLIQEYDISCIKGNHEYSVIANQKRWRQSANPERMIQIGRVIDDDTLAYLESLPDMREYVLQDTRIIMGHGTPWSDVLTVYPDSRQGTFDQLFVRYGDSADIIVLGHTHQPMQVMFKGMLILNPGSIYGTTIRDSHTCATLTVPEKEFHLFDVRSGDELPIPITDRTPQ